MRGRKALLLGLAIVLVITAFAAVSCGGSDEAAKATLLAACTKIEAGVAALQTQFTAGGTVPQLKAAKDAMAVDWKAVVEADKRA